MDKQRSIQIFQELVNNTNLQLSQLNSYLNEAYSSPDMYYNQWEVDNLRNENNSLNSRINDLQNMVNDLQNQNQNLVNQVNSGSASNSAEVDALRMLVSSLTSDKDYLNSQLMMKDQNIADAESRYSQKNEEVNSLLTSIGDKQNEISNLTNQLVEASNNINSLNIEIGVLNQKMQELQTSIENAKSKIESELNEAISDIDAALDDVVK